MSSSRHGVIVFERFITGEVFPVIVGAATVIYCCTGGGELCAVDAFSLAILLRSIWDTDWVPGAFL